MSLLELMTQLAAEGSDSAVMTRQCTAVLTAEATEALRGKDFLGNEVTVETALYVASNLEAWETKEPHLVSRDTTIDGVCYRRLDPEYYAWLRHKMVLAKKASESGRLAPAIFDRLRTRFNQIHDWALSRFGEQDLLAAVRMLDPSVYSALATSLAANRQLVFSGPFCSAGRAGLAAQGRQPLLRRANRTVGRRQSKRYP